MERVMKDKDTALDGLPYSYDNWQFDPWRSVKDSSGNILSGEEILSYNKANKEALKKESTPVPVTTAQPSLLQQALDKEVEAKELMASGGDYMSAMREALALKVQAKEAQGTDMTGAGGTSDPVEPEQETSPVEATVDPTNTSGATTTSIVGTSMFDNMQALRDQREAEVDPVDQGIGATTAAAEEPLKKESTASPVSDPLDQGIGGKLPVGQVGGNIDEGFTGDPVKQEEYRKKLEAQRANQPPPPTDSDFTSPFDAAQAAAKEKAKNLALQNMEKQNRQQIFQQLKISLEKRSLVLIQTVVNLITSV